MRELWPQSDDKRHLDASGLPGARHGNEAGMRSKAPGHLRRLVSLGLPALVALGLLLQAGQRRFRSWAVPSQVLGSPQNQIPGGQPPLTRGIPSIPSPTPKQNEEMLKQNFAKMKDNVDELAQLAKSLQDDVDKSNANVLSLKIVHKADKIEKLARKIKASAKGF